MNGRVLLQVVDLRKMVSWTQMNADFADKHVLIHVVCGHPRPNSDRLRQS
jgi:hypothetical protein